LDHILIVDDDPYVLETVSYLLGESGYQVSTATDGDSFFAKFEADKPNLILLDIGLGQESGLELVMQIRKTSTVPVIMLTGKTSENDKVVGLELGADDYVAKPYSAAELLARIKSVLRRSKMTLSASEKEGAKTKAEFSGWKCDLTHRKLFDASGKEISLTSGEFQLLTVFLMNAGRVLSRKQLLDGTHREETFVRSIDVQIMRLRRKIEIDASSPQFIKSIRAEGYIFAEKINWS